MLLVACCTLVCTVRKGALACCCVPTSHALFVCIFATADVCKGPMGSLGFSLALKAHESVQMVKLHVLAGTELCLGETVFAALWRKGCIKIINT